MGVDSPIGSVVGGFRIERLIGRGAMGAVYLAGGAGGRPVALKLLSPELAHDERFRQRFLRESRLAGTLDHPNVVRTLAAGGGGGGVYPPRGEVCGGDPRGVFFPPRGAAPPAPRRGHRPGGGGARP